MAFQRKGSELVDFDNPTFITQTDKAWLFDIEGQRVWIAKSQGQWDGTELTIPEWLAIEKELV